jgi:hypothetical protein
MFTGNNANWISWFKTQLEKHFELSELGEGNTSVYLKTELIHIPEGIFMTQRCYVKQTLDLFGLSGCQPAITPTMVEKPKLALDTQHEYTDPTLYRSMVGKLTHLTHSRPDIACSISIVSRFMARPQISHLQAVKRIFRYISGTADSGILFRKATPKILTGYVDFDYAGCMDSARSMTGFVLQWGPGPITWHAKKQPTMARKLNIVLSPTPQGRLCGLTLFWET